MKPSSLSRFESILRSRSILLAAAAVVTIALLAPQQARAQTEKEISSSIDRVTVYTQGARIVRTASASLAAGQNQLVFTDLPEQIIPGSVRLTGTGSFTILAVSTRTDFHGPDTPSTDPPEIAAIRARLEELRIDLAIDHGRRESTASEERYVTSISESNTQEPRSVADMVAAADFLRDRLPDIRRRRIEIEERIKTMSEEQRLLNEQLREYAATVERKRSTEVLVTVDTRRTTNATFEIEYLTDAAAWTTRYDLRVADLSSPIELTHFSDIRQRTGEEWNRAMVTLSTGNPRSSAVLPQLIPWRLRVPAPATVYGRVVGAREPAERLPQAKQVESDMEDMVAEAPLVESIEYPTVIEYSVENRLSVPADGKVRTVELRQIDIDAATIPDWATYDLESSRAAMFIGNVYVGDTHLSTDVTTDTLVVPLGPDPGITANREKKRDFSKVRFLGSKRSVSLGFRISVRNSKSSAATIIVRDQVPVSTDRSIEVDLGSIDGASFDAETGFLEWTLEVQPGSTRSVEFDYTVKFPRDMNLVLE